MRDRRADNPQGHWTEKQERILRELIGTGLTARQMQEAINPHGPYKSRRAVNAKIDRWRRAGATEAPHPITLAGPAWSIPPGCRPFALSEIDPVTGAERAEEAA